MLRKATTVLAMAVLMVGCAELEQGIAPGSLRLTLPLSDASVGARMRPFATGTSLDGAPVGLSSVVEWSSSDERVASFVEPGILEFKAVGVATLTARYQGEEASAQIHVSAAAVNSLTLTAPQHISVGQRVSVTLTAARSDGTTQDVTMLARWTLSGGFIRGGNDQSALARFPGMGVVRATFEGKTAERTLEISAVTVLSQTIWMPRAVESGTSLPLTLMQQRVGREDYDASRDADWQTSDARIAYVTNDERGVLLHAVLPGTVVVTAMANDQQSTAMLMIDPLRVQQLAFAQQMLDVNVGDQRSAEVFALRVDGTTVALPAGATWTSSDESVATVSDGRVTGVRVGQSTITVRFEGTEASVTVTVQPQIVVSLEASVRQLRIQQGAQADVTLAGLHEDGSSEDLADEAQLEVVGKVAVIRNGAAFTILALEVGTGQVIFHARDRIAVVDITVAGR